MPKFELRRQTFHFMLGTSIAVAIYLLYPIIGQLLLIPLIFAIIFMLLFPYISFDLTISHHILFHLEREHDKLHFPFKGAITFGMGILLPVIMLPPDPVTGEPLLACATIAILAAGDSISTMVGKFHGKIRIGLKSLEGFLAFVLGATVFTALMGFASWETALVLSVAGAIIEFIIPLDDNIGIPVGLTFFYLIIDIIAPNTIF